MRILGALALGLTILGTCLPNVAHALSASDVATLRRFVLTDLFVAKLQGAQEDESADVCALSPLMIFNGQNQSISEMAKAYDAQPGVHAILEKNGLTAYDQIVGTMVLMFAGIEVSKLENPSLPVTLGSPESVHPLNINYVQTRAPTLRRHSEALVQKQLAANNGKPPPCVVDDRR